MPVAVDPMHVERHGRGSQPPAGEPDSSAVVKDRFARWIIAVVVAVWAAGAVAQMATPDRYVEPWWIHVLALSAVSCLLTGRFDVAQAIRAARGQGG